MTTFLGGCQLIGNIQVLAYKNDVQYWLSIYKDDKFIDFLAYGPEISGLTASVDGKFLAHFQKSSNDKEKIYFMVWKLNESENEIVPYYELYLPFNMLYAQCCFNTRGTHVICLSEWNRVHVIDLRRLDAATEFYIPNSCDEIKEQVIYDAGDCFVWFGQDEFIRVVDVSTGSHPKMWTYRVKNTRYLVVHKNRIIHMTNSGIIGVFKINLVERRLDICYDVNYPTGKYEDMIFEEYDKIVAYKKNGEKYCIDL